ncbi:hypothetical protein PCC8801_0171 [Rippkaea orientalis PCC 8801]|uniref:Uncharacterized protein n=1 Tax=Rippkaea orientalis (strain PCC 8801 / RF-1) TaxID=41431 RepID=B7K1W8_RIPO1|nr:hypothetical protein [Rippkaea orientalis]ACK64275.1 hypothetical protein PCC8801_0171 [Rippkaea orientalis PCC 8801]
MLSNDQKTKELLTEMIIGIIQDRKDLFHEIILEAIEEIGLAKAIQEGREDNFISEETIFSLLDGEDE